MGDVYDALVDGFHMGLAELRHAREAAGLPDIVSDQGYEEMFEAGRRAASVIVTPLIWRQRLGDMEDTAWVCEQLDISRQAVAKKVAAGQLLALPAGRTRSYPVWQFDVVQVDSQKGAAAVVREEVPAILDAFHDRYPEIRPIEIAAWAHTPQPELADASPEEWLDKRGPLEPVLAAARRGAAALAQ